MKGTILALGMLAAIAVAGPASTGSAQIAHRDHFLTFATPVALPDGQVLPAAKYLFRLGPGLQGTAVRNDMTQILSEDGLTVFATLFTMPVQRSATDGFEVTLVQTSPARLPLLKAWFCDRNGRTGHQFVATPKV